MAHRRPSPIVVPLTSRSLQPRPHYPNQGYLPNGTSTGPSATTQPLLPNNGRVIQQGATRVLCIADVRGNLRSLNELAKRAQADHILHTGDFGFYDESSLERIADKTLKHVAQYSPLLNENIKRQIAQTPPQRPIKQSFPAEQLPLSELPLLLNGQIKLDVPVYTVWGACEDVRVLEKFRSGEYKVDNLHIIDEMNSRLLDVGGVKLRLLGLGGAVVIHKLFDNGEGKTYIAGGQGTMWTTLLQIGALIDTASRVYDPSETRVFLTHASPARDGILNQLSVTLKADFSISAGLHFRYGSSYNEFSVNPSLDHYRGKLAASKASFNDVWETVRMDVEQAIASNDNHKALLQSALEIVDKMPTVANGGNPFGGPVGGNGAGGQVDESAFKNMWNFNLADAAFGYLVLEIDGGRIGTEMRAQGFNFAHRGGKPPMSQPLPLQNQAVPAPVPISANTAPSATPTGPAQRNGPAFAAPASPFPNAQQHLQQQQQQQQQAAGQQPQPVRTQSQPKAAPSPAPAAPPVTQTTQNKPTTPQPSTANVNVPPAGADKPAGPTTNGTTATDKPSDGEGAHAKPSSPAVEQKPSTGLYVTGVESEQQAKEVLSADDFAKNKKFTKIGKYHSYLIDFESHEQAQEMITKALDNIKAMPAGRKPKVQFFHDKPRTTPFHGHRDSQIQGGAGTWQSSSRGGAPNSNANNASARAGYQSGGASDSEGGRGRGGFRGRGRGRADGERGGRPGRGGGRGSFQNTKTTTDGATDNKPAAGGGDAPATSAPAESS